MKKYKGISFALVVCLVLTMMPVMVFAEVGANSGSQTVSSELEGQAFADMTGHWAAQAVSKWAQLGIVKGDSRGFRPDDSITRAELAVILDNLMDYQSKTGITFTDVKSGVWYADAVAKANAAGILNGDGAGHALPNAKVTREQAAVMLARAFGVDENAGEKTSFKDTSFISKWAKTLVFGMEADKYIGGMGTGNFEPKTNITRAQVVTMIDNAVAAYLTKAGVYSENITPKTVGANCVVIVKSSGVILKSAAVSGDLIVAEGVGKGDFTLDGTTISGKLIARGGGENSIHVINGADIKGKVTVEKVDGVVRIVSDGVVISTLEADAEVILEGEFTNVAVAEGAAVEVRGKIANLNITGKAEIKAAKDSRIENLTIEDGAKGTNLDIDKNAAINKLEAKADMTTSGAGAPKSVTGTGAVTVKGASDANLPGGGGGGGGTGGDNTGGNTTDKRSLNVMEEEKDNAAITGAGIRVYFTGTDQSGASCKGLSLGVLTVKEGETLLSESDYSVSAKSDSVFFNASCFKSEGKHTLTYNIKTSDGKTFTASSSIYVVPATTTVLYDTPQSGSLKIYQFTGNFGSGTRGAVISSGSSVTLGSSSKIEIELAGLPADKRVKSVTITKSYYGYTQTDDYTDYFISSDLDMLYTPQGTVTVQVVTEDVPASLPEISGVEFYLDYDEITDTYTNPVTSTVPALDTSGDVYMLLFAKVLFADGGESNYANYLWEVETSPGTYDQLFTTNYNYMNLYESGTDNGYRYRVTASGYSKQSQGTASATIYVSEPLHAQSAPTGLNAVGASSATAKDGKITGTTTDMEYKLSTAADSAYATCTAGEVTGLGMGTYYVRLKAKPGYALGVRANVVVLINQAAPTGLVGIAPTGEYSGDAKISNTTTAMEWKRSSEFYYSACSAGETTVALPGTYHVRYPEVPGQYFASTNATVTIAPYVAPPNQDQAKPVGLTTEPPSYATGNNGKIIGTKTGMEYRSESGSTYSDCSADETAWLYAGIYYVRYKAKPGYNASADTEVVITAPAFSNDATLQSLHYSYYYDGDKEQTSVPDFDPLKTSYDISLYGNIYGKTFEVNPYASQPGYATVTYSAVTVGTGEYTAVLKAEVTAEDGVTKVTYTVNITVERRSGTASISSNTYVSGSAIDPVITMVLTNRDGDVHSLENLIGSTGSVSIKDQFNDIIGTEYYTVDEENSKITINASYFTGKPLGMTCVFNVKVTTADGYTIPVQEISAPYVTIN